MQRNNFIMAFPEDEELSYYEPSKIHFSSQYISLENIFSPLIEYSPDGKLVSGIAERFEWIGNEAHFTIRPDLKTIDGHKITAEDVEQSFKRLFILGSNTHGGLKDMLCPGVKLTKLTDACPGMGVRDNSTFVMKFREKKLFLFPMLAAMDFAIIPRNSIDTKTLKIIDYRNISGPYYVERDNGKGNIELSANPHHYHYAKNIPHRIKFIPSPQKESLNFFTERKIDHITTVDYVLPDETIIYAEKNPKDLNIHITHPIKFWNVIFTRKGRSRFSNMERIIIGKKLRKMFSSYFSSKRGFELAEQIFPVFGEAGLSKEQISDIRNRYDGFDDNVVMLKEILIWNGFGQKFAEQYFSELKNHFPNLKIVKMPGIPGMVNYEKEKLEEPDLCFLKGDMGFQEDIGLLSYCMNKDFFYLYGKEGKKWLESYMTIPEKTKRLELLRDLHYKTLYHGCVIPIAMSPYTAIVRKPWKFNFSKYHANNPLWRIYKK